MRTCIKGGLRWIWLLRTEPLLLQKKCLRPTLVLPEERSQQSDLTLRQMVQRLLMHQESLSFLEQSTLIHTLQCRLAEQFLLTVTKQEHALQPVVVLQQYSITQCREKDTVLLKQLMAENRWQKKKPAVTLHFTAVLQIWMTAQFLMSSRAQLITVFQALSVSSFIRKKEWWLMMQLS